MRIWAVLENHGIENDFVIPVALATSLENIKEYTQKYLEYEDYCIAYKDIEDVFECISYGVDVWDVWRGVKYLGDISELYYEGNCIKTIKNE